MFPIFYLPRTKDTLFSSLAILFVFCFFVCANTSGEGNGNPVQCSCLENSMDRGVWQATVHRVAENQT